MIKQICQQRRLNLVYNLLMLLLYIGSATKSTAHCSSESFVGVVQTIVCTVCTAAMIATCLVKAFGFGIWLANGPAHVYNVQCFACCSTVSVQCVSVYTTHCVVNV
jgi:hypothetical protein